MKEKSLKPDVQGIPVLEGHTRKVYLEFQGYRDPFIRYRLMANVMTGCAHEKYAGTVFAGIVYTDGAYKDAALPINAFGEHSNCCHTNWFTEVALTDYTEAALMEIDPRLVLLAPFTVRATTSRRELTEHGRRWRQEIDRVYDSDVRAEALDVIGFFVLNRFRNLTREEVIAMLGFDLMDTKAGREIYDEGIEKGMEKGIEKGMEKGMLDDAREMVIEALQARFAPISGAIIDKIHWIAHREVLKEIHKQAITCKDIDEFQQVLLKVK